MLITFSMEYAGKSKQGLDRVVCAIVYATGVKLYPLHWDRDTPFGNLTPSITWANGRRVRFTIRTRDSKSHGSRRSAAGRRMPHASWEAHRDVMRALFQVDPAARIKTALATYEGSEDFERSFMSTEHKNVGSRMHPVTIRECSV